MAAPYVITITDARVKFGDPPASGSAYDIVAGDLDDYGCNVTQATIAASANTVDVAATFCSPASQTAAGSSFALTLEGMQDWGRDDGSDSLSEWLFKNDAARKAFALFLKDETDPKALGIVTVIAGDFGGTAGEPLTFSGELPILGYPDIKDKDGNSLRPSGAVAATGATSGTPGTFTPAGATPPANLAAMTGITATPNTAWATGSYVVLGDSTHAHWSGTAWASGDA